MFLIPPGLALVPRNILPNVDIPTNRKIIQMNISLTKCPEACYTPYMDIDAQTHTQLDIITAREDLPLVDVNPPPERDEVMSYPPLTVEEETFALAIIETSGNIAAAYKMVFGPDSYMPLARGKDLLSKPAIALKIRSITDAVQEASLISVGAHLDQLAKIRDLSVQTGQLKTAYMAERSRGEAVGIYQKHDVNNKSKGGNNNVQINVVMASKHDENI